MADGTQSLTALIVSRMNPDREYTKNERQVFMYGVELILNSLLKVTAYLVIGFSLGKGRELIAALFIFGGLRKFSGGKHARTNSGCFIITGSILSLGIGIPYLLHLPEHGYLLAAIMIWILYARFAPCDQYYKDKGREEEARQQKVKTLIILGGLFAIGYFQKSYWQTLVLSVSLLQGITLIELKG